LHQEEVFMKDVRLNNGTMMTDEQFVMERGMRCLNLKCDQPGRHKRNGGRGPLRTILGRS
jgi:hypothetical protein